MTVDARIFSYSRLFQNLMDADTWPPADTKTMEIFKTCVKPYINVDAAFRGSDVCIRPFPRHRILSDAQRIFNKLLMSF